MRVCTLHARHADQIPSSSRLKQAGAHIGQRRPLRAQGHQALTVQVWTGAYRPHGCGSIQAAHRPWSTRIKAFQQAALSGTGQQATGRGQRACIQGR